MEVYVDDMLVKSAREVSHLDDLWETFDTLRLYDMKLNPSKCVFVVALGKFLGFMVSQHEVEVNPDKVRAIMEMAPPKNIKEVQSLNGRVVALNRFVSWAMDKCLPFFKVLRKAFDWIDNCQGAYEELKAYLASPPLLSLSKPNEELSLYLAVSLTAVSSALIRKEDWVQLLVYYISQAFQRAEGKYPSMEKLAFGLIIAAWKLKLYFQVHTIVVRTDKLLWKTMNNLEVVGRLVLWAFELGEFDVQYRPRTAIKAQALANFIAKFTTSEDEEEKPMACMIWIDGSSNQWAKVAGILLRSLEGDTIECAVHLQFSTTNNEVKYEVVLSSLDLAKATGAKLTIIHCDSQVVVGRINGNYEAKGKQMKEYLSMAKSKMARNSRLSSYKSQRKRTSRQIV